MILSHFAGPVLFVSAIPLEGDLIALPRRALVQLSQGITPDLDCIKITAGQLAALVPPIEVIEEPRNAAHRRFVIGELTSSLKLGHSDVVYPSKPLGAALVLAKALYILPFGPPVILDHSNSEMDLRMLRPQVLVTEDNWIAIPNSHDSASHRLRDGSGGDRNGDRGASAKGGP